VTLTETRKVARIVEISLATLTGVCLGSVKGYGKGAATETLTDGLLTATKKANERAWMLKETTTESARATDSLGLARVIDWV